MPAKQDDIEPDQIEGDETIFVTADNLNEVGPEGETAHFPKHTPVEELPDWLALRVLNNPLLVRGARRVVTVHYEVED